MVAQKLSGRDVSADVREKLSAEVSAMRRDHPGFGGPGLTIVQVGGREDSNVYIRMKLQAAEKIGIRATHERLPRTVTQSELLRRLSELNADPSVHGVIVQMPLDADEPIDSAVVTNAVHPDKDVDGLSSSNEGKVATGDLKGGRAGGRLFNSLCNFLQNIFPSL